MSGTRLPGDSESNDRHKAEARAETRLSGDLARRFTEYRETRGADKSDVLRNALDEYLPASENSAYVMPRDPDLADAYLALACDRKRVIRVEEALDILSDETHPNTGKGLIKENVLKPLEEGGLIGVAGGRVAIHPLTLREEVETTP